MRSILYAGLCILFILLPLLSCVSPEDQCIKNGDNFFEQSEWTLAISEYEEAKELDPEIDVNSSLAQSYLNRAACFSNNGQWMQAVSDIEQARELSPDIIISGDLINTYLFIADDLLATGDYDAAKMYYETVLEIDSRSVHALNGLGYVLVRQGLYEEATGYLDIALKVDSEFKFAYVNRCEASMGLGRFSSAMMDAKKLMELYPKSAEGYYLRAKINFLKNPKYSIYHDIMAALAIDPCDIDTLNLLGVHHIYNNRWDSARGAFDWAIDMHPNCRGLLFNRALVCTFLHQYDLAIADASRVIALAPDPDNPDELAINAISILSFPWFLDSLGCLYYSIEPFLY
jgi:tetratricopeptide (TPR) repeat protein